MYSFLNFAQAKTNLSQRLYDSGKNFWTDTELGVYFKEALQTFNALSNFKRGEFVFNSRTGVTWYDLTDTVNLPNTTRPLTITDADLISQIQYHLLEPQNVTYPLTWAGSKQFAFSDIVSAIEQTRDQILFETACTLTQSTVAAVSGRTYLPGTAIDLRRVCWIPVANPYYTTNLLLPGDTWGAQAFEAGFPQYPPGNPNVFMRSTQPPLGFDVDIQPAVPGTYDLLTVNSGEALSYAASTVLPIPNDWCWIAKWGALSIMLNRDSASRDSFRAKYCLDRFKQGVALLMMAPALLAARIDNVPVSVDAVRDADYYRASWQGLSASQPDAVFYTGLNLLALSPAPNAGPYSITASVIENMGLPSSDTNYIQIGQEDMEAVLGEAQHIALFKCGGAEFQATMPLHASFVRHCSLYNSKLTAMSEFRELLYGRSQRERAVNPIFSKEDPETIEANLG